MDSRHFILGTDHSIIACDLMTWANWLEADPKDRIVQQDRLNGYLVSTVFLGLDYNFSPNGPPLLFETMIFVKDSSKPEIDYQERHSTWDQALEGHRKACEIANTDGVA